jgi:DNA-binding transcriptional regulator YiaG
LNNKTLVEHNISLAQKLQTLELSNENSLFNSQSYSDFYQNICGINLSQKDEIDNNLIVALQKTLPKEDETITAIRKYLGISKNVFAIILALIHLVKYN